MGSLKRGLSAGFGAAADLYKGQYLANLQQRHNLAMEEVRNKYRVEGREQAGIISGRQNKAKIEAATKEKAAGREHAVSLQTQKDTAASDREHLKGIYGLREQDIRSKGKTENGDDIYPGYGGKTYSFDRVEKIYKLMVLDRVSEFDLDEKPITIEDFARDKLGIKNFIPGPDSEAGTTEVRAGAGSAPGADPDMTEEQQGNIKQGNARGYYLNLKRRFPGDSEKEIRAEVKKRYPSWNG